MNSPNGTQTAGDFHQPSTPFASTRTVSAGNTARVTMYTLAMVMLMIPFRRRISTEVAGALEVGEDALRLGEEGVLEGRAIACDLRARPAWMYIVSTAGREVAQLSSPE